MHTFNKLSQKGVMDQKGRNHGMEEWSCAIFDAGLEDEEGVELLFDLFETFVEVTSYGEAGVEVAAALGGECVTGAPGDFLTQPTQPPTFLICFASD